MTERDEQWELDHLHVLVYDEIGMCGCGWSDAAYGLIRDLLGHFHDRDDRDVVEMIGGHAAAQVVLYRLQDAGLIDHGTSVTSSWITHKGRYARWLMHRHPALVEYAGYPSCWDHERGRCPDECWTPPAEVPPEPARPSMDELMERARLESETARAAMNPVQRAVLDAMDEQMTNLLLYGQHPAPENPPTPQSAGFAGLFGDPTPYRSAVTPIRDAPPPWRPGRGVDPIEDAVNAIVADEIRNGHSIARSQWAPRDCTCPWPWPMSDGRHILTSCPHYTAPERPVTGHSTRIGCQRYESGTWVHGDPHDCPRWVRG